MSILKRVVMYRLNLKGDDMTHPNHEVIKNLLEAICRIVSESSSDTYAVMILKKFNKEVCPEFPFIEYIHLNTNRIDIKEEIDSIDKKRIGMYIQKLMNSLFSDLFKRLVKREIGIVLLEDLKEMDIKF